MRVPNYQRSKKHLTKKQAYAALILTAFIASTLFIDAGNAAQTGITLQSSGTIMNAADQALNKTEFLIRGEWINAFSTSSDVDNYVSAHPWGTGIMLTDYSSGILSIISYTGWNPNQTWFGQYGGPTFAQLKAVIDEFHKLGWKVVYAAGNVPDKNDKLIYNYLTQQHPELIAVAGDGQTYNRIHQNTIMVNFFAKYSTPDTALHISPDERLSDLYVQRLSNMISDGSFQWDGWFGVDGWNGFVNQEMSWVWKTNQPFGRWVGTDAQTCWYYGDTASIQEWANSTYASGLPANWKTYTQAQQINYIQTNYNLEWWNYWMDQYAKLYGQINQVFYIRPAKFKVGSILSQDLSSTWADNGMNNCAGMENLTAFAKYNSFSMYYIDMEWSGDPSMCGRYAAYVAGLVKSKIPTAHCVIGLPIAWNYGEVTPELVWKQMYLAQAETYVWNKGTRYRAVDPFNLIVFVPGDTVNSNSWIDKDFNGQKMANWVTTMANFLNTDIVPTWLGPTEVMPLYLGNLGAFSVNFTFSQFADSLDLNNSDTNFVSGMQTVFLDAVIDYGNVIGGSGLQNMISLFEKNQLNVIYYGSNSKTPNMFLNQGSQQFLDSFKIAESTSGTSNRAVTLPSSSVTDPNARYIIGDSYGQAYNGLPEIGNAMGTTGLTPIIKYEDGYIELGISQKTTSSKFVYGKSWSQPGWTPTPIVSRDVINRAIMWASNCPISSSDSLIDTKIFVLANGDIALAFMNLHNASQNISFTLDLTGLGLNPAVTYNAKWAYNDATVPITNLGNVTVSLVGSADIMIIPS